LWAYHAAGLWFLVYSFLRTLPWEGGLIGWALDQAAAAFVLLAGYLSLLVAVRKRDPVVVAAPLAAFALILVAQESWRMVSRLSPPPSPTRAVAAPALDVVDPNLPNVYHIVLDGFQPQLFDVVWPAHVPLDGFVLFTDTHSLYGVTVASMASVFASQRPTPTLTPYLQRALAAEESLPQRLRAAGYRTVAYLPPGVYPPEPGPFDAIVWHAAALPSAQAAALHRWLFFRLWLATTLPARLVDRLAVKNLFGLSADDLRSLKNQRMSVLTQPVTTILSFERYLDHEPRLPPAGRYTLVHLLVPHNPFVLAADCSHTDLTVGTDVLAQSRCAAQVMRRFLAKLDRLGRLRDSMVLVHSDHGSNIGWVNDTIVARPADTSALLLLKPPRAAGTLTRAAESASLLDVTPTLLRVLGLPSSPRHEGRALLPVGSPP
jgi:hypothetical protein